MQKILKARIIEIEAPREENQRLRYDNAQKVFEKDMKENCEMARTELEQVKKGMDLMNTTIESVLEDGGSHEELEIWHLHKEHINKVYENGGTGQGKKVPVHKKLLMWNELYLGIPVLLLFVSRNSCRDT